MCVYMYIVISSIMDNAQCKRQLGRTSTINVCCKAKYKTLEVNGK